MDIVLGKAGTGKSTELIARFLEAETDRLSILISNEYDAEHLMNVCEFNLKLSKEEIEEKMHNKIFFHLTKPSAEELSRLILRGLEGDIKNFFIDESYDIIIKSELGIDSILQAEDHYGAKFTITLQKGNRVPNNEHTLRPLARFGDKVNIIEVQTK